MCVWDWGEGEGLGSRWDPRPLRSQTWQWIGTFNQFQPWESSREAAEKGAAPKKKPPVWGSEIGREKGEARQMHALSELGGTRAEEGGIVRGECVQLPRGVCLGHALGGPPFPSSPLLCTLTCGRAGNIDTLGREWGTDLMAPPGEIIPVKVRQVAQSNLLLVYFYWTPNESRQCPQASLEARELSEIGQMQASRQKTTCS